MTRSKTKLLRTREKSYASLCTGESPAQRKISQIKIITTKKKEKKKKMIRSYMPRLILYFFNKNSLGKMRYRLHNHGNEINENLVLSKQFYVR